MKIYKISKDTEIEKRSLGDAQKELSKSDSRNLLWSEMEKEIQDNAKSKDPNFSLDGDWKEHVGNKDGFKIYAVDGDWVRRNLSFMFGSGGHGYVHEFIPHKEIWISIIDEVTRKRTSQKYFMSAMYHEIEEWKQMNGGKIYFKAHQDALRLELKLGILSDPYEDNPEDERVKYLSENKDNNNKEQKF